MRPGHEDEGIACMTQGGKRRHGLGQSEPPPVSVLIAYEPMHVRVDADALQHVSAPEDCTSMQAPSSSREDKAADIGVPEEVSWCAAPPDGVQMGCPKLESCGRPVTGSTRQECRSSTKSVGGCLPVFSSPQSSWVTQHHSSLYLFLVVSTSGGSTPMISSSEGRCVGDWSHSQRSPMHCDVAEQQFTPENLMQALVVCAETHGGTAGSTHLPFSNTAPSLWRSRFLCSRLFSARAATVALAIGVAVVLGVASAVSPLWRLLCCWRLQCRSHVPEQLPQHPITFFLKSSSCLAAKTNLAMLSSGRLLVTACHNRCIHVTTHFCLHLGNVGDAVFGRRPGDAIAEPAVIIHAAVQALGHVQLLEHAAAAPHLQHCT